MKKTSSMLIAILALFTMVAGYSFSWIGEPARGIPYFLGALTLAVVSVTVAIVEFPAQIKVVVNLIGEGREEEKDAEHRPD